MRGSRPEAVDEGGGEAGRGRDGNGRCEAHRREREVEPEEPVSLAKRRGSFAALRPSRIFWNPPALQFVSRAREV